MKTHRIELSLPIEAGTLPDPERVVPVFHAWIRERLLDEVLVDVARYGHVKEGPAVLLVGHSGDYVIAVTPEGTRLSAVRKRGAAPDAERLADVAQRLVVAASLLEVALPEVRFRTDDLSLRLLDRLNAPNTPETFAALGREVAAFAREWLGAVELEHGDDRGGPLEIRIRRAQNEPVAQLAARLPARPS